MPGHVGTDIVGNTFRANPEAAYDYAELFRGMTP
jgi:hypothetical protein